MDYINLNIINACNSVILQIELKKKIHMICNKIASINNFLERS